MPLDAYTALGSALTFTRGTKGGRVNEAGAYEEVASGAPRYQVVGAGLVRQGILIEPAATNAVRNPRLEGLAAGSPGTMPTNMSTVLAAGIVRTLASASEGGLACMDLKLRGMPATAGGVASIFFESATNVVAASVGQRWTISAHVKHLAGALPDAGFLSIGMEEWSAGGVLLNTQFAYVPLPTRAALLSQLAAGSFTVGGATTAYIRPLLQLYGGTTDARFVDATLRVAAPQAEQGFSPTARILPAAGTPLATPRAADVASITGADFTRALNTGAAGSILAIYRVPPVVGGFPRIWSLRGGAGAGLSLFQGDVNITVESAPTFAAIAAISSARRCVAVTWAGASCLACADGSTPVALSTAAMGAVSELHVGHRDGAFQAGGVIEQLVALPYALGSTALQDWSRGGPG